MMKKLVDTLYTVWIIGTKDILDALKNKSSRSNIVLTIAMVAFFYFLSILRPFDKNVGVVVYDEGYTKLLLESITLKDGAEYSFRESSSLLEMKQMMGNQNLGLVLPEGFDQKLAFGGTPILNGYIFWADRMKVTKLEEKYSQAFSEIFGQPVQVVIGHNIVIPGADEDGMQTTVTYLMIYFVFSIALLLIPFLMVEEKQTKTLEALLTSPVSPGEIVLGKALAGFFYILVTGGLAMVLYSAFIVNWAIALAATLGFALLAIGLGLAVGSLITSMKQSGIWMVVLIIFIVVPPLFYMESNLKPGIRTVLTWFPSSALASLFRFACSTGVTLAQIWPNLAVTLASITAVFALVIWKVRCTGRK